MADDLIGKTLGNYDVKMILGKGGMSTVYLAEQSSIGRTVAVKVLPRELMHEGTFLSRFKHEILTVSQLEHPHILPVYDAGEIDGVPYIAMRYVRGGTVADQLDQGLPSTDLMLTVIEQIADALDYAHERDVIHRDLKPSNILLDEKGNAYLTDFGVARTMVYEGGLTGSRVIGTPPYIAPEAIRKDDVVTGSVDIYALGVIAFEMLTGAVPYQHEDAMKVLVAHVLEPVPSARSVNPNVPVAVDAVVRRALAKSAEERFEKASGFANALQRAFETTQPNNEYTGQQTVPSVARRRPQENPSSPPTPAVSIVSEKAPPASKPRGDGGLSCLIPIGVVLAMIAGVIVTAFVLTQGNIGSLFDILTPIPTINFEGNAPLPTLPPEGAQASAVPPTLEEDAIVLAPPSGGDRLAFASNRDGDFDIYLIDVDGSNLRPLTENDTISDFDPAWSPDGTRLVYASDADGVPGSDESAAEIWVMNADGTAQQAITNNDATDADPHWSPDGRWIAFSSDEGGTFDIYMMRPDGSERCRLTRSSLNEFTPRWSPDGQRISYHARSGGNFDSSELYLIELDLTRPCDQRLVGQPERLTNNETRDLWPDWSPDGQRLVFSTRQGLEGNDATYIAVLNLLDLSITALTEPTAEDDDPTWSPDGTRIAFDSTRGEDFDLYILDIQTRTLTRITTAPGADVVPVWQPR